MYIVLQNGKTGLCGSKSQQNRGHADQTAAQPGGHRNAKSTSKSTHTRVYAHTPGPGSPFTRQIQTHTHTLAHLLLSSHRRGSFHASNFKGTRALTHRRTQTSISSSYDKSEKSAAGVGVCVQRGEGGTKRIGKKQWRFFPLVNDFPFMKLREGCISIQPRWSLRDSIGKWPAVIKQCGGKNTEEYSEEKLTFFYCVELHKSQQITKGETNQKYSSAPSVLQNSRAWGTAHPTFVSLCSGPLIDGLRRELVLVEVFNAALLPWKANGIDCVYETEKGGAEEEADREKERCCLTGQVCNSTS